MRIDQNQIAQPLAESSRTGDQSAASVETRSAVSNALGEDQAQLSGNHLQVHDLTAQALQLPEIRQEKVNALRQVVQNNNYQPGSGQVADAIFTHMLVIPAA